MSYQIALQRIQKALQNKDDYLFLLGLGLTEIPKEIQALKGLKHLDVGSNEIRVIENLQGLPLESLGLHGNKITKIQGLGGLPLQELHLSYNQIHTIENLQGLPLRSLTLYDNKLSSIESLQGLHGLSLKLVHLGKNDVSKDDVKEYLKKILPNCKVFL